MNKSMTAAKKNKAPKAKAKSLKMRTNVKAGKLGCNRCEFLRRQV